MIPFWLQIGLRSPIILNHRLMLDSILYGAAFERYGADAPRVPLFPQTDGMLHVSQAFSEMPDVPRVGSSTHVQSFIRVLQHNLNVAEMLVRQPNPSAMSAGRGPNSNIESTYLTHDIPTLHYFGVAVNGEAITWMNSLFLTVSHVGAQCHKGHGEVADVSIIEMDVDPTWYGIVGMLNGRKTVMRPVPKRYMHRLPAEVYGFENDETWHYPYFAGDRRAVSEPCLVPPVGIGDYFDLAQLRELSRGLR